jgi:hypothetical protein
MGIKKESVTGLFIENMLIKKLPSSTTTAPVFLGFSDFLKKSSETQSSQWLFFYFG